MHLGGSEPVRAAEGPARGRGPDVVGIGVGKDNARAAALYARLGYRPVADHLDRHAYEDHDGTVRECVDPCTFPVKELASSCTPPRRSASR